MHSRPTNRLFDDPPLIVRQDTDTATPRTPVPIYFIHDLAAPFCNNPYCQCQNGRRAVRGLYQGIAANDFLLAQLCIRREQRGSREERHRHRPTDQNGRHGYFDRRDTRRMPTVRAFVGAGRVSKREAMPPLRDSRVLPVLRFHAPARRAPVHLHPPREKAGAAMSRQPLPEQHGFYYDEEKRIPRRSSAPQQAALLPTGSAPGTTRTRRTAEDSSYPMRPMVRRLDHLPLQAPKKEYMIPLTNGTALYVTEQELLTMGQDYIDAAQLLKARRQPQPNVNRASPPDVIRVPAAQQRYVEEPEADYYPTAGQRVRGWMARGLVLLGIGMIIMIAGYIVLNIVGNWWTNTTNGWAYGYPRTYQTDHNVGHGTTQDSMSHFIAENLNGRIIVIEIPGGDPSKSEIYIGPRLVRERAGLNPRYA